MKADTLMSGTDKVQEHMTSVVSAYVIPDGLSKRFDWLAAGDVSIKQQLLSRLQAMEVSLVVEAARQQLPVMLDHLRSEAGRQTHRMSQTLTVGKHDLEIRLDKTASGVSLENWAAPRSGTKDSSWLWWLLAIGALVAFFAFRR